MPPELAFPLPFVAAPIRPRFVPRGFVGLRVHLPWWQDQFADLATWLPTFAMPPTVCASPILDERFRSSVLPELVAFDPSVPAIHQAVFELSELLLLSSARVGVGILLESAVLGVVLAVDRLLSLIHI